MEDNQLHSDSNKELLYKDTIAAFVHYFSSLDSKGLTSILKDDVLYDEQSKQDWTILFEKQFESLKRNNIHYLKHIPGICSGCKKGCSGYTFLDEVNGFFVDLVIEVSGEGTIDFTECVNLKNKMKVAGKKEQVILNPVSFQNKDEVPF